MQYGRAMNRLFRKGFIAAITCAMAACGGNSTTGPSSDGSAPSSGSAGCVASVTGLPSSVGASETRTVFTVSAGSGCSWTARPDAVWADVAPSAGIGTQSITLTVTQNTSEDSRTVMVLVNNQSHQIRQSGRTQAPCTYVLSTTSITPTAAGESGQLNVTAPVQCPWTASASESWITVNPTSGTGNGTIDIRVAENFGGARSGFMTIAGQRIDVRQEGR